jgi:hypothetical protein
MAEAETEARGRHCWGRLAAINTIMAIDVVLGFLGLHYSVFLDSLVIRAKAMSRRRCRPVPERSIEGGMLVS